jgi:hypothetical protein
MLTYAGVCWRMLTSADKALSRHFNQAASGWFTQAEFIQVCCVYIYVPAFQSGLVWLARTRRGLIEKVYIDLIEMPVYIYRHFNQALSGWLVQAEFLEICVYI